MLDLRQGDNRLSLRRMIAEGEFVHSVVCDPPYGLVSVNKRFGGANAAPAKYGSDGLFARQSKGFMGKLWDGSGIERDPEFWNLVYQVMLPGAYIVAFSSSRTYGYMQVAMEAVGFITHPMLGWTFASGFPKAHNASRAIDKALGVERPVVGRAKGAASKNTESLGEFEPEYDQTIAGSPEAQQWDGWSYGGQALKPALEPIYMGQKPFSEKNGALNILRHGVGAINIDACRVGGDGPSPSAAMRDAIRGGGTVAPGRPGEYKHTIEDRTSPERFAEARSGEQLGRWPANLLHDNSPEVVALFPDSKGQLAAVGPEQGSRETVHCYGNYGPRPDTPPRGDSGSAARFFNSFPHEGPILHYPKANKKDRAGGKHPTVKPVPLLEHLQRLVTPPGGTTLDPFAGSGTSGQAALNEGFNCILMEAEAEYCRDIRNRFSMPATLTDRLVGLTEAFR